MHFFNMTWENTMKLPITRYNILVDQSLNLLAGYRQNEFSFLSQTDKQLKDKAMVSAFHEFEQIKGEI